MRYVSRNRCQQCLEKQHCKVSISIALARTLMHSNGRCKCIVRRSIGMKSKCIPSCLALIKPMLELSAEALMLAAELPFLRH